MPDPVPAVSAISPSTSTAGIQAASGIFSMTLHGGQHLRHPQMPGLPLPRP